MSHPTLRQILRYLHGECEAAEVESITTHLGICSACRQEAEEEGEFDRRVRRAMEPAPAPPPLVDRIRRRLADETRAEALRRSTTGSRAALAAAAAFALIALLAVANPGGLVTALRPAGGSAVPAAHHYHGQLVCLGCARVGMGLDGQRRCLGRTGDREHVTGLQTADGALWRLAENEAVRPLLGQPELRGQRVHLEARAYPEIGYLGVVAVHPL